ncbi:MAG: hypothetical protein AAFS02_10720 [Pseudomonadota bacterium]
MPPETNQQEARRAVIRRLLRKRTIRTQAELAQQLESMGHLVTQSSVSRDLREMNVIKDPEGYRLDESAVASHTRERGGFVRGSAPAGNHLLVVKTAIGAAQRVAVELDRSGWPEIVGTLSGDDTIFIATSGAAANRRLQRRLADWGGSNPND